MYGTMIFFAIRICLINRYFVHAEILSILPSTGHGRSGRRPHHRQTPATPRVWGFSRSDRVSVNVSSKRNDLTSTRRTPCTLGGPPGRFKFESSIVLPDFEINDAGVDLVVGPNCAALAGRSRDRSSRQDSLILEYSSPMKTAFFSCIKVAAVLGLAIGAAGTAQAGPNLVLNGNFGTGDYTNWALSGDNSEAFVSSGQLTGSTFQAALTTSAADNGFLMQTLATVAGQQYTYSFLLGGDGGTPNSFSASLGGTTLVSLTNVADTLPAGTTYTGSYTASSILERPLVHLR